MKKEKFMNELKEYLAFLPDEDVKDVLEDYEEHFEVGKKKKRTEAEIAKSLGDPKDIAKDVRTNLRENESFLPFELFAVNFWVAAKDLFLQIFGYACDGAKEINKKLEKKIKTKSSTTRSDKVSKKTSSKNRDKEDEKNEFSAVLGVFLILFNVFIFVWIWLGVLITIISLYIASISVILSGVIAFLGGLFVLMNPVGFMLKNISYSVLFSGIGVALLGVLMFIGTNLFTKGFGFVTKAYFRFNKRIIGGKRK